MTGNLGSCGQAFVVLQCKLLKLAIVLYFSYSEGFPIVSSDSMIDMN